MTAHRFARCHLAVFEGRAAIGVFVDVEAALAGRYVGGGHFQLNLLALLCDESADLRSNAGCGDPIDVDRHLLLSDS